MNKLDVEKQLNFDRYFTENFQACFGKGEVSMLFFHSHKNVVKRKNELGQIVFDNENVVFSGMNFLFQYLKRDFQLIFMNQGYDFVDTSSSGNEEYAKYILPAMYRNEKWLIEKKGKNKKEIDRIRNIEIKTLSESGKSSANRIIDFDIFAQRTRKAMSFSVSWFFYDLINFLHTEDGVKLMQEANVEYEECEKNIREIVWCLGSWLSLDCYSRLFGHETAQRDATLEDIVIDDPDEIPEVRAPEESGVVEKVREEVGKVVGG